jgi:hypothetical protein
LGLNGQEKTSLKAFLAEALAGEDLIIRYPKVP